MVPGGNPCNSRLWVGTHIVLHLDGKYSHFTKIAISLCRCQPNAIFADDLVSNNANGPQFFGRFATLFFRYFTALFDIIDALLDTLRTFHPSFHLAIITPLVVSFLKSYHYIINNYEPITP